MRKFRHLIYVILLIVLDQFTKHFAVTRLKGQEPIQIIPNILQLHYHENNGAIWGIMSGKIIFLIFISSIIMIGMVCIYLKIPKDKRYNLLRIVLLFIAAGAIGNLIDRSTLKYVVDFIYFEIIDFPIFNLADSYITVSAILLIVLSLFYYKDEDFAFLNSKEVKKDE